jgi:excisionase family DNA binding protein
MSDLLTTEQAAQELGVSAEQIRRYVKDGELHPINVGRTGKRKRLRFEPTDIESFKQHRKVTGTPTWQPSTNRRGAKSTRPTSGLTAVSFLAQQEQLRSERLKSKQSK